MISRLTAQNFRAFKKETFEFSRLNIFVGPNNAGKSSALSALNLIAQSTEGQAAGSAPIVLNGQFDQLGTFRDMVHGGRANTPVKLALEIDDYFFEVELKYRSQRREVEIFRSLVKHRGNPIIEYSTSRDRYDLWLLGKNVAELDPDLKRRPNVRGIVPSIDYFRYSATRDSVSAETLSFLANADRELFKARSRFQRAFRGFESLYPFRDQPQRTYLYSGEVASTIGRSGQNTVNMMANDSSRRGSERVGFVEAISNWLVTTGISSGLKVKHLTERHYEIVVTGQDGTDHNICDVGFGVSQVLPVLVAGLNFFNQGSRSNSVLVVQEPEIHLHPNAQAALGTFFVGVTKGGGQIFLETHSDNLVLRVARHVALGDLEPSDVAIYFISNTQKGREVTRVLIDENGGFRPDWPGGFFPQRQAESLELAKASIGKGATSPLAQLELFEGRTKR